MNGDVAYLPEITVYMYGPLKSGWALAWGVPRN